LANGIDQKYIKSKTNDINGIAINDVYSLAKTFLTDNKN